MSDMYLGSQAPIYQNVLIQVRDAKTGKIRLERQCKNRITRLMLWGIAKFLSGEFNDSSPDKIYEYIPNFLALGSNKPNEKTTGVTTNVTVNDTQLLNEYTEATSTGMISSVRRISIQGRQHNKTTTHFTDNFVKFSLSAYVSSNKFDGLEIGEAGLFSKEEGNNCVARVVFAPFQKKPNEVIDIQWDITLLSYGTTKYPENVVIEGPNKIIIPLMYTPYKVDSFEIGLRYEESEDSSGWLYLSPEGSEETLPLFSIDENGKLDCPNLTDIFIVDSATHEIQVKPDTIYTEILEYWESQLNSQRETLTDTINNLLSGSLVDDNIVFTESGTYSPYYLGYYKKVDDSNVLLADNEGNLLTDRDNYFLATSDEVTSSQIARYVMMSKISRVNITYEEEDTTCKLVFMGDGNYIIQDSEGQATDYKVTNMQIYHNEVTGWEPQDAYLHNGEVINSSGQNVGYKYNTSGEIFKIVASSQEVVNVGAFVIPSTPYYEIYEYTTLEYESKSSGYFIDWEGNKEVYQLEDSYVDSGYHLAFDEEDEDLEGWYFVTGYTHRLVPIISPSDATDRSVTWSMLNKDIAKINNSGIVEAWSVGETMAVVATTNNIKARVTVKVVKNASIVLVDSLTLNPSIISLRADDELKQSQIVEATVLPAFATYNIVSWSQDISGSKIFDFVSLGDNKCRVTYNKTGNIGRGYLIATTQDGTSVNALVQVGYDETTTMDDCDDDYHNQ